MGLFGFLGKVAKAGLGVITGGASTVLLDAAGAILHKPTTPTGQSVLAAANLGNVYTPNVKVTTAMPGGAKLRVPAYMQPGVKKAKKKAAKAAKAPKAPKAAGSTRSKRVYAAWKAAGKPGTFFAWVKTPAAKAVK